MKIKKDEGLTFDIKNEGTSDIKLDDPKYYTDVYEPGQTKTRLKIGREVEGTIASASSKVTLSFTVASGTDGDTSFTGFGFTPTSFEIEAVVSSSTTLLSKTFYIGTSAAGWKIAFDGTANIGFAYDLDNDLTRANASFEGFEEDGITLDIRNADFAAILYITAYS